MRWPEHEARQNTGDRADQEAVSPLGGDMSEVRETLGQEEVAQKRILHILAFSLMGGGAVFTIAALVMGLTGRGGAADIAAGAGIGLFGILTYILVRRGYTRPAGLVAVILMLAVPTLYTLQEGTKATGLLLFLAGVIFADLFLGGYSGLVVAVISTLLYLGVGLAFEPLQWVQVTLVSPFATDLVAVAAICIGMALVSRTFTQEMRRALWQARERETALRSTDEERERLLAKLRNREEAQRRLLETVQELGSPVIPLARGVIAMPLIGAVDSDRARHVITALMEGVTAHRARVAIVDITGVPVVDTAVAGALLKAAQGVRLLGAEPVLTGIRPEVAQTLVGLGLDLSGVTTRSTLEEGLLYAQETGRPR